MLGCRLSHLEFLIKILTEFSYMHQTLIKNFNFSNLILIDS